MSSLIKAAQDGNIESAKLLLPQEAGKRDKVYAMTALMWAAFKGHTEMVKLLIPHEAGLKDNYDSTALMKAARMGHTECVKLLMPHEAGLQDKLGHTALMLAALCGYTEIVKLLIDKESGLCTFQEYTALMLLVRNDPSKQDNEFLLEGWSDKTPIIKRNQLECAKLLIPREMHITDRDRKTPLDIAREKKYDEIYELIQYYKEIEENYC